MENIKIEPVNNCFCSRSNIQKKNIVSFSRIFYKRSISKIILIIIPDFNFTWSYYVLRYLNQFLSAPITTVPTLIFEPVDSRPRTSRRFFEKPYKSTTRIFSNSARRRWNTLGKKAFRRGSFRFALLSVDVIRVLENVSVFISLPRSKTRGRRTRAKFSMNSLRCSTTH